jgi:hypothetical protein
VVISLRKANPVSGNLARDKAFSVIYLGARIYIVGVDLEVAAAFCLVFFERVTSAAF